ncbi:MAG: RNA polymerase sigma factor [Solirubrobacteraceae bacterium]
MSSTSRLQQIAALHDTYDAELAQAVAQRVPDTDPQTLEDACSFAWMQLLTHPNVNLNADEPYRLLAWLTQTAVRQTWLLNAQLRATIAVTEDTLAALSDQVGQHTPSSEQLALLHDRLDLVRQLPQRPRRFLLRLMLGYGYREIATAENTTYRVVDRQIARARRLLRELDQQGGENTPPDPS